MLSSLYFPHLLRPDNNLVGVEDEANDDVGENGVELDDVTARDRIDIILQDDAWVSDVT